MRTRMSWYARELGQIVLYRSLHHARSPAPAPLFLTPPSRGSGSKGRMSKPLPALTGPHPQLDPTFPCRRQALPPPAPGTTPPSVRKSLKIVPRAPPPAPLLLDFADIFPEYDSDDEESCPTEEQLRSRWSCSTIATLTAGAKTPSSFDVGETAVSPWFCCVSLAGL
jgi:hypothetical protein